MQSKNIQVLMAAMHQTNHSVIKDANIQTDAIVVNQSDRFNYEETTEDGKEVLFITLPERGVGLSRNTALMRAEADIVAFADQDIIYKNGYEKIILDAFKQNPKADMMLFNVNSLNPERPIRKIKNNGRVRKYNCLRYGTVNIAIKLKCVRTNNINFSLLFGGGAKYSSGEDSLFIYQCIKSGLKVYRSTRTIADVEQEESTWFEGYTDKFFIDKGALFKALSPRLYALLILQFALRKKRKMAADRSILEVIQLMKKGAVDF